MWVCAGRIRCAARCDGTRGYGIAGFCDFICASRSTLIGHARAPPVAVADLAARSSHHQCGAPNTEAGGLLRCSISPPHAVPGSIHAFCVIAFRYSSAMPIAVARWPTQAAPCQRVSLSQAAVSPSRARVDVAAIGRGPLPSQDPWQPCFSYAPPVEHVRGMGHIVLFRAHVLRPPPATYDIRVTACGTACPGTPAPARAQIMSWTVLRICFEAIHWLAR